MRKLDGKFHIEGEAIVKTSSGEVLPEDEPLFFLRGRDRLALAALTHYRVLCVLDGCNDYQLAGIDERIAAFEEYAALRPTKQPGVTRGAAWVAPGARRMSGESGLPVLEKIVAPWTEEQVAALNRYQARGDFHEYACGTSSRHAPLVATTDGWVCRDCDYRQDWAHAASVTMADAPSIWEKWDGLLKRLADS
jgi:hypothetical protein